MVDIPVIETERLRLRAPEMRDFPAYAAFRASDRARHIGGPSTEAQAWGMFSGLAGQWALRGYGRWIIADRETDAALGVTGVYHPVDWPEPEIAWSLFAEAEGRGIAYEGALATRRYVYEVLGWDRIVSLVHPDNTRSLALAERLGCVQVDVFDHVFFGPMPVWLHPASAALGITARVDNSPAPHEVPPTGRPAEIATGYRADLPRLETDRLILRPCEIGDFDTLAEIFNGPGGDGIGGPKARDAAWFDFAQMTATWLWRGHGYWTVVRRDTGDVAGFVGIGMEPGDQEPELGYMLRETARGRGIAREACRAAADFAHAKLGLQTLVSYIHVDNASSCAVAERLGAVRDTEAEAALAIDDCAFVYRHHLNEGAAQ